MKLKVLGSNMTQVEVGKYRVLFSYETPVAAFDSSGKAFKTSQKFSSTTSKHISKFLGSDAKTAEEKPQSFFNSLTSGKVEESIKESLGIEAACGFLDVMSSFKPLVENFDGDEEVNEDSSDKSWYVIDRNNIIYAEADSKEQAYQQMKSGDLQNEDGEDLKVAEGYEDSDGLFTTTKTVSEEDESNEKKYWYTSGSGKIEFQMTMDQAESVGQPGQDAEEDVRQLMRDPDMKEVIEYLQDNMDSVKEELKEQGAWNDEELQDEDMNIVRIIWIAGNDIKDRAFEQAGEDEVEEQYEELDLDESHDSDLSAALRFLNRMIDAGEEFPDASAKAAMKFDVNIEELTDAYDNQDSDDAIASRKAHFGEDETEMKESNLNESSSSKDWEHEDVIDSRDIIERIEELENEDELDESEQEELNLLKSVAEEGEGYSDWEHGETLINSNYWVDYCAQMVKDIGDLPQDIPNYIEIDWQGTADNLSNDYSRIDVGNSEFYIRS
jgi:hypothetical protein